MLICCCGEHNTPGDQTCPGDCVAAIRNQNDCAISGHATRSNLRRNKLGLKREIVPVPEGEHCFACGQGEDNGGLTDFAPMEAR